MEVNEPHAASEAGDRVGQPLLGGRLYLLLLPLTAKLELPVPRPTVL